MDIRHQTNALKNLLNSLTCLMKKRKAGKTKYELLFPNATMKRRAVRFRGMERIFARNNQNKYTGR